MKCSPMLNKSDHVCGTPMAVRRMGRPYLPLREIYRCLRMPG